MKPHPILVSLTLGLLLSLSGFAYAGSLYLKDLQANPLFLMVTATAVGDKSVPVIHTFTTSTRALTSDVLQNHTARVLVSWQVDNRPDGSNLVFEQVLANGQAVNVELPRSNAWVASEGEGVVAPMLPLFGVNHIVLRLRVIDLTSNDTLASSQIDVPLTDRSPSSQAVFSATYCFDPPFAARDFIPLNTGLRARVTDSAADIGLTVYDYPAPYDQPIGSLQRGETVRILEGPSCYASSTGAVRQWKVRSESRALEGWVNEYTGPAPHPVMVLEVEIIRQVDPAECFDVPFRAGIGIEAGKRARVTTNALWVRDDTGDVIGLAQAGETAQVVAGPDCYRYDPWGSTHQGEFRRWQIQIEGRALAGWVHEYDRGLVTGTTYNLEPLDSALPGNDRMAEIISFTASPTSVEAGGTITVTWEVYHASSVSIRAALTDPNVTDRIQAGLPLRGSTTVTVPDNVGSGTTGHIHLYVYTQANTLADATETVDIALSCPNDFFFGVATDCATGEAQRMNGAYQAFEGGFAIWRNDNHRVYGFFADGSVFSTTEAWHGETITYRQIPPEGRLLPQRGFGQVWVSTGFFRDPLGWATAPEQGYTLQVQPGIVPGGTIYPTKLIFLSTPEGRTIRVVDQDAQSTWAYVQT